MDILVKWLACPMGGEELVELGKGGEMDEVLDYQGRLGGGLWTRLGGGLLGSEVAVVWGGRGRGDGLGGGGGYLGADTGEMGGKSWMSVWG